MKKKNVGRRFCVNNFQHFFWEFNHMLPCHCFHFVWKLEVTWNLHCLPWSACSHIAVKCIHFYHVNEPYSGKSEPNPFQHNDTFWRPWETSLLKTLWEKEKLLVTSNLLQAISPFPTVFSTHSDNFLPFSSNLKLSSANSFSLEESKICRLVMG